MRFCYIVTFENASPEARLGASEKASIAALVAATPALTHAEMHTPAVASDIYTADGPSPQLCLQLYFDDLLELEAAISAKGHLQALADTRFLAGPRGREGRPASDVCAPFRDRGSAAGDGAAMQLPRPLSGAGRGLQHLVQALRGEPSADHAALSEHQADRDPEPRRLDRRHAVPARRAHAAKPRRLRQLRGADRGAAISRAP